MSGTKRKGVNEAAVRRPRNERSLLVASPLLAAAMLFACSALVGIEELHEEPPPDANAGAGGDSATGGAGATGGDAGSDSSGGSAGAGGAAGDDSGGASGSGGMGGGGDSGAGGDMGGAGAGGQPPDDPVVRGRVIDFFRHPLPNVPVQIGATLVLTNTQGEFMIDDVGDEYDVSLVVEWDSPRSTYGWVFQGLTRRDPTLQVYRGLTNRSGNILVTPENYTSMTNRTLSVSLGGPDGQTMLTDVGANGVLTSASWRGPATTQSYAHGLIWDFDEVTELPTAYVGYAETLVALAPAMTANVTFDFATGENVNTGAISGTVTGPGFDTQTNQAFVRFTSSAAIEVVEDYPGPATFNYLVPSTVNSSITIAASEGSTAFYGAYAIQHKSGLVPGQTGVALEIPSPVVLLAPALDTTGVDSATEFRWATEDASTFVWFVEDVDFYQGLWVVTGETQVSIPSVLDGGFALRAGGGHVWSIETHGDAPDVDALAGPTGFLDSFSASSDAPVGPRQGDGSYTVAEGRYLEIAP